MDTAADCDVVDCVACGGGGEAVEGEVAVVGHFGVCADVRVDVGDVRGRMAYFCNVAYVF